MAEYSHKIKATELVSGIMKTHYRTAQGYAQIHKAGCAHTKRMVNIHSHSVEEHEQYLDDYYEVAPCAR